MARECRWDIMSEGTITLYIASSVDGFIATDDGGVAWLDDFQQEDSAMSEDYEDFFASTDCLLFGSKTYKQVLEFGEWPYGQKPSYVLTGRDLPLADESVKLYNGETDDLIRQLKERYEHIWLVGGAQLAQTLVQSGEIDAFRLSIVPIILESGIRLFNGSIGKQHLRLIDTTSYENGVVELYYETKQ